jgi:hypothetical protein
MKLPLLALLSACFLGSCVSGNILAQMEPERPSESEIQAVDIGAAPSPEEAELLLRKFVVGHLCPSTVSPQEFDAGLTVKCDRIHKNCYPRESEALWKIGYSMAASSVSHSSDGLVKRKWRMFFRNGPQLVAWERADTALNINGTRDIQELDPPLTLGK